VFARAEQRTLLAAALALATGAICRLGEGRELARGYGAETADSAVESSAGSPFYIDPDQTTRAAYLHWFGALALGRGLRLNNPYRLQEQLGDRGESLSLSATYLDASLGATWGGFTEFRYGFVVHFSEALQGVAQDVVTPGVIATWRLGPRGLAYGRLGVPVVLRPDTTGGIEAALGGVWHATAGAGLTAELIGSLFYGAATWQRKVTTIPIVALQVGVFVDYEVLP
jgi:hypothetical protein